MLWHHKECISRVIIKQALKDEEGKQSEEVSEENQLLPYIPEDDQQENVEIEVRLNRFKII